MSSVVVITLHAVTQGIMASAGQYHCVGRAVRKHHWVTTSRDDDDGVAGACSAIPLRVVDHLLSLRFLRLLTSS
jgi:hypothetical protein